MTVQELMAELASLGTAQNRKTYQRHGAGANQFGVSFAHLDKLKKRIKTDNAMALALWDTGNCDARILATMIADPAQAEDALLERWVDDIDYPGLCDAFAKHLVFHTALALEKMRAWTASKEEWRGRAGWVLVALSAMAPQGMSEAEGLYWLDTVERGIADARNKVKDAMNNALIAIGMRGGLLEEQALAAACRIGKVQVDHGDTACKTPDAAAYIAKAKAWKNSRRRTC